MKTIAFTMLALGLALAALPAAAQGQTSFVLETHTEAGSGYFTLEGQTTRNPTLNVAPGEEITITIRAADATGFHNICVDNDDQCSEYVQAEGDVQELTFTAPASGTVQYYCLPHKGSGMIGEVVAGVSSEPTPTTSENNDGGGENGTPGLGTVGVAVAMVGVALLLARRK